MPEDYLADLERKSAEIERQIRELQAERELLESIIRRRKVDKLRAGAGVVITKKNETQIFVWGLIRHMLQEEQRREKGKVRGLRTKEIFERLSRDIREIKYTTVRSHLHRLSKEGRIYQKSRGGIWRLTEGGELRAGST